MKFLKIGLAFSVAAFSNLCQASTPQPPTNVRAIADNGKVTVTWTAPTDTGGLPLKSYTARYDVKGPKCTVSAKKDRCTVSGLKNGRWYSFYVTAKNKDGTSAPSENSEVVIPSKTSVDAQCGTANNIYRTSPPTGTELCLVGFSLPATHGSDGVYYWNCVGIGQGKSVNCKSSGTAPPPPAPTYSLGGKGPAGGIVFYLSADKQHGMEAGPALSSGKWGCNLTFLGITATTIGSGVGNTQAMIDRCAESKTAAHTARGVTLNGYNDWYLPSQDEMIELVKYANTEDPSYDYYTSTEVSDTLVIGYTRAFVRCDNGALCYGPYVQKLTSKVMGWSSDGLHKYGYLRPVRKF